MIFLLLAAACTDEGEDLVVEEVETTIGRGEIRPIVNLAVTDWTGSRLNVAIAEQLIELRLGYPVTTVEVAETDEMLRDLQSGELDAVLEIWPSSLLESEQAFFDDGRVDRLGELGVIGKTGWFVPGYVIEENPDLATWEGYSAPQVASDFATEETGDRGRFLGSSPLEGPNDEDLVTQLALPFDVVYSGSDEATMDIVAESVRAEAPVLLFWWTPTAEAARFDLVNVELPDRTSECEADLAEGRPQSCDYPTDELFKAVAPDLSDRAPELYNFLKSFMISTEEQLLMIDQVANEGRPVDEVAAEWISQNRTTWEAWLNTE